MEALNQNSFIPHARGGKNLRAQKVREVLRYFATKVVSKEYMSGR